MILQTVAHNAGNGIISLFVCDNNIFSDTKLEYNILAGTIRDNKVKMLPGSSMDCKTVHQFTSQCRFHTTDGMEMP